jgi:hypothetical protein
MYIYMCTHIMGCKVMWCSVMQCTVSKWRGNLLGDAVAWAANADWWEGHWELRTSAEKGDHRGSRHCEHRGHRNGIPDVLSWWDFGALDEVVFGNVRVYVYVYTYNVCIYTYIYICSLWNYVYIYIHIHIYTYTYSYIYTCIDLPICLST